MQRSCRLGVLAPFVFALAATSLALGSADTLDPAALTAGSFTTPETGAAAFSIPIATLYKEQAEAFAKAVLEQMPN